MYSIQYNADGSPEIAEKVLSILKDHHFSTATDNQRGLDHGVFVPLNLMFPEKNIPVIQVSLLSSMKREDHIKLGKALSSLRDEGILILCSGQMTHGFKGINFNGIPDAQTVSDDGKWALDFDNWVTNIIQNLTGDERNTKLQNFYSENTNAKEAHPTADHFLPLIVAAAAAGSSKGIKIHNTWGYGVASNGAFYFL